MDAVRFMVKSERGSVVEIAWATERNHHPVAVGILEIDGKPVSGEILALQAFACASAYLRQTHAAPALVGRIASAAHP